MDKRQPAPIRLSDKAWEDLKDIHERVMLDAGLSTADKVILRIMEASQTLAEFPEMGRRREDLYGGTWGLRSWVVQSWLVFTVHWQGTLHVLRVVHGAMDLREIEIAPPPGIQDHPDD